MENTVEKDVVESYGGTIMLLEKVKGDSTTDIIKKVSSREYI